MSQNKSILHLCTYTWEVGGPSSVIYNHASYQSSLGINNSVLSTFDVNHHPYTQNSFISVFYFSRNILSAILPDFSFGLLKWYYAHYASFDIIQIHGLWNFGSILPFLFPKKSRIIVTIHGFLDPYVLKNSRLKKNIFWFLFHRWQLKKADIIHVMSEDEHEILKNLFPNLLEKIRLIPNGYTLPISSEEPEVEFKMHIERFLEKSTCTFLFLGRLHEKKGISILIQAFKNVMQEGKTNVKLIIAGPDDGYLSYVKSQIDGLEGILLLPAVRGNNKNYLLKEVDIFLLPSYSEGFSVAALEAIAYGKACIFSPHVGFSNLALQNNAALICDTNEVSLQEKMEYLCNSANLRADLGHEAKLLYDANFTTEVVGKQFLEKVIYDER
jgi:glycosyltransferase involved in cell wall biosynthesis